MSLDNVELVGKKLADLHDIVEQTYYLEQKVFEWKRKIDDNKQLINKSLGRKNSLNVRVDDNLAFSVLKSTKLNIEFFPDQVRNKVSKEVYNKVVDKIVEIKDVDALIKTLKWYGVPPKEFKNHIKVSHKVDNEKIDNLIDLGQISIADIEGCYKVDFDEDIRVRKTK